MGDDGYRWVDEGATTPFEPGAVLLSSFPSAGLAATVAAHYLIRAFDLPRVGFLDSPESAPVAVVQQGKVNPPTRVYGRKDLGLVLSEFPPTIPMAHPLAEAILAGAEQRKARMVICLEGVVPHPVDTDGVDKESVWFVPSRDDDGLAKSFTAAKAGRLEDGVIGGVTGSMLVSGLRRQVPVVALLVSAQGPEGYPDHRAGAALIETLDRLMPELKIDTEPLRSQAEVIERALRAAMRSSPKPKDGAPGPAPPEPTIYQ